MREEYDIANLNPRKNPYAKKLKRQITINIDSDTIDYLRAVRPYRHPISNAYQSVFDRLRRKQAHTPHELGLSIHTHISP